LAEVVVARKLNRTSRVLFFALLASVAPTTVLADSLPTALLAVVALTTVLAYL
jgi:hypothetical protein